MARVTGEEVKAILSTALSSEDLGPFIATAHTLVNVHLSALRDPRLSEDVLQEIELWLAAHFAAIRDPRVSEERVGDESFRYQGQTGTGLDATTYGQQARLLDPTGALVRAMETRRQPFRFRVSVPGSG